MSLIRYGDGHENRSGAAAFPHEPMLEKALEFPLQYASSGIAYPVGGGVATLAWDALDYDEAIELLDFLGLNQNNASKKATISIPDLHRVPIYYNCVITLSIPNAGRNGWWSNMRIEITGAKVLLYYS